LRGDGAKVVDEVTVVAYKPKEATHRPRHLGDQPILEGHLGDQPILEGLDFLVVHRHTEPEMTWPRQAMEVRPNLHLERARWE
jgi:hypothetical protein